MTPQVSVIVPVYNCKELLPACLESIAGQTFTNWECILADDGSTDGSAALCDEYAARDSRFKVIHKPNGGVCSARNAGAAAAAAEYIIYCDQDDQISPFTMEIVLAKTDEHPNDLLMWHCTSDSTVFSAPVCGLAEVYPSSRFADSYCTFMFPSVWNKLFQRTILEQAPALRFDQTIHNGHEDMPFVCDYFARFINTFPQAVLHLLKDSLYYWNPGNDNSVSKQERHYRQYAQVELDLLSRFADDCETLYGCTAKDMTAFYLHFLHTMAFGVVCAGTYHDLPKNFFTCPQIRKLLHWFKANRTYSPYYLPFRLKSEWLIRFLFAEEEKHSSLYWKFYWLGYYLLGGGWQRG